MKRKSDTHSTEVKNSAMKSGTPIPRKAAERFCHQGTVNSATGASSTTDSAVTAESVVEEAPVAELTVPWWQNLSAAFLGIGVPDFIAEFFTSVECVSLFLFILALLYGGWMVVEHRLAGSVERDVLVKYRLLFLGGG